MNGREKRATAAGKYLPARVRLLLVAEAPPEEEERYFYFESVRTQDSLFRHVSEGILGTTPERHEKANALAQLRARGVFLIDASEDPLDGAKLAADPEEVIGRCQALAPSSIILIKVNVYDDLYGPLAGAGLPVIDERLPFPGSGQQKKFKEGFARALTKAGMGE